MLVAAVVVVIIRKGDLQSAFGGADAAEAPPWAPAVASVSSFLAGLVIVSHIGVGNAITTFLVCIWCWKVEAKTAMVTAIVAGGWTSIAPFLVHLLVLKDVPMALWVMVLPGVYLGARIAPLVHGAVG